jgi:hypothetical protein
LGLSAATIFPAGTAHDAGRRAGLLHEIRTVLTARPAASQLPALDQIRDGDQDMCNAIDVLSSRPARRESRSNRSFSGS